MEASRLSVLPADRAARAEVLRLLSGQFTELEIAVPAERLAQAVDGVLGDGSRGVFLLALHARESIGVAYLSYQWTLEHGGKIAWLEELYIEPRFRSLGLGRELLAATLDHARSVGCLAVDLEVEQAHPRAANLYRREGFVPLGRSRFYRRL
jgi:GNAT superfamily N-acetyltransferase